MWGPEWLLQQLLSGCLLALKGYEIYVFFTLQHADRQMYVSVFSPENTLTTKFSLGSCTARNMNYGMEEQEEVRCLLHCGYSSYGKYSDHFCPHQSTPTTSG